VVKLRSGVGSLQLSCGERSNLVGKGSVAAFKGTTSGITASCIVESTPAPLVVLVININIYIVGLIFLPSIFHTSSTAAWQGHEDVDPFKMLRTTNWLLQDSTFLV
jgi:hypothetical protein